MRTKVTLVLVLLNVALFFYIVHKRRDWSLADQPGTHRILPPEAAGVRSLTIASSGASAPIHLELNGKEWDLISPVAWPANPNAVDHILNELQLLEYLHPPFAVAALQKNGQSLADYGLDPPALTLTFTAGSATTPATFLLRLGTTTALDNQLYLLSPDGTKVEVVSRSLVDILRVGLDQLCSGAIFTIQVYEARELSLQGATSARTRLHHDGDRWSFESPIVTRADKTATERAISGLTSLNVVRFLDESDLARDRTGLDTPALVVNLLGNNRQETLRLGREFSEHPPAGNAPAPPAGGSTLRYAKLDERKPTFLVEFPNQLFADLDRAQETLRDHRVLDFDPAAVTALTLTAPGQPSLVLQRLEAPAGSTAAWQIARSGGAPPLAADHDLVQNLLERLALLSAKHFVSDAPTPAELETEGFNRPEREVVLTLTPPPGANVPPATANTTLSVQIALGSDKTYYARVAAQPFIYEVPSNTIDGIPVAARVFRDRTVHEFPTGAQITGLVITAAGNPTPIYRQLLSTATGETWPQALAGEPAARLKALSDMLVDDTGKDTARPALLRRLRAKRFVRDDFSDTVITDGRDQPWKYRLDLTIALTGGAAGAQTTTSTLFFADRSGGTQLAGSPKSEADVVFELDPPLMDALFTLTNGSRDAGPAIPPTPAPPVPEK